MKKVLYVFLGAVLMTIMLPGCSKKAAETATAPGAADKDVNIYMFVSSPEYADAIGELIKAYKDVKPNVTINYETTQNDYPTLLKAKLNSGESPDIFSSTSGKEIGVYLDYSADLANEPLAQSMSDPVKAVMMSGDEVHGLSIKGNYFGIVYNKGIFEEVGISSFPQTFSELETACKAIQAAGYQPFSSGFAEWWVYKHVFQHFMYAAQPDDVEGLVKAFISGDAHMKDYPALYNDFFNFIDLVVKYGDTKPLESDLSTEIAALGTKKAAMVSGQGAWIEADVLKIDPSIQIGFDGYPINEDASLCKVIAGSDQAVRISKDSPVLEDVLDFVNWWYTSDYGKSWFSDVAGVIPPIKGAKTPDFEVIKQGNAHVDKEGAGTLGVAYSTDSFHQAFGEIMQSYVAGVLTKDAACAEIETKWVELEG
ncbi:ABC transporter substrate-binding protein [Oceanispirochaeta sp.]|jgi:raffinose/stachyose/melibiose transport system substrate-binding protein|uniref:ABC transporter substrate-binding protein n=1 Tax=Oceanispirochaeta sp. TaxID=2035350 RepID=UPI00262B8A21|nr:extracellular solute-binding protein [Oceanispirochaeta sp.]MDA3955780.1 extracellular solute-binding protein [Oceanispirochaeta sp.]